MVSYRESQSNILKVALALWSHWSMVGGGLQAMARFFAEERMANILIPEYCCCRHVITFSSRVLHLLCVRFFLSIILPSFVIHHHKSIWTLWDLRDCDGKWKKQWLLDQLKIHSIVFPCVQLMLLLILIC